MKKLFTTLALAGAFGYAANAQVDLAIDNVFSPINGSTYDNLAVGVDSILIAFQFSNNGTESIVASDTLYFQFSGIFQTDAGANYTITFPIGGGYTLAAGDVDTVAFYLKQGETIASASGTPIKVKIANNAIDTFGFLLFSRKADGNLIIESDFTAGTEPDTWNVGENNVASVSATFGDPTSILNFANAKNITVFPNPTANQLNFAFDFEKASNAAVRVYDIAGRLVVSQDFGKQAAGVQNFNLDVTGLANGNYTLELATDNNKGVSKFVIAK